MRFASTINKAFTECNKGIRRILRVQHLGKGFSISKRQGRARRVEAPVSGRGVGETEMTKQIRIFLGNDSAATAVEYALIGGFVALAVITGLTNIGVKLSGYFSEASSSLK